MTEVPFEIEGQIWRRCEEAWMAYMAAQDWVVTRLADAVHNFEGAAAPLMQVGAERLRAPDLQTTKAGGTQFWEVKYRTRATLDPLTGERSYWLTLDSFRDYLQIGRKTGSPVWVILHDAEMWEAHQKWLRVDVEALAGAGRREKRRQNDGVEVDAWVWPVTSMDLVPGPPVILRPDEQPPILPQVADEQPFADDVVIRAEGALRRRESIDSPQVMEGVDLPPGVYDVLRTDNRVRLDALRRSLAIPQLPRYSVMRLGSRDLDMAELLEFMRYGIRVFLVSDESPEYDDRLTACRNSRLFEWAEASVPEQLQGWVVDGRTNSDVDRFLEKSCRGGDFNFGQFRVVHHGFDTDILVSAGAGTGKTETMSERIVFLLATCNDRPDPRDPEVPFELSLADIALITFTKEAASEMRSRIARTLMLRQRLCDRCVLPTIAWLLGISQMEVETIHTYSKKIIHRDGMVVGLGPAFSVGSQTMDFRRLIDLELSPHLAELLNDESRDDIPPIHEIRNQIQELWEKLSGNGFSPLSAIDGGGANIDWGTPPAGLQGDLAGGMREVVYDVASKFLELCARNQIIPVSELVSSAARVVAEAKNGLRKSPRFLFVDEFQDTDSEQISMIVGIRASATARLFVVGDQKQGIYRFRGAEGNAFKELKNRAKTEGFTISEFDLNRNFRSRAELLGSMHHFFDSWGKSALLNYGDGDRLVATRPGGAPMILRSVDTALREEEVVDAVRTWLEESDDNARIGILCRRNREALEVREWLQSAGISCEIRVGGDFFRSPVVRELRVLLEATLNPVDDAALLEFAESRWGPGLCTMLAPRFLRDEERTRWGDPIPDILSWRDRVGSLAVSESFARSDLEVFRIRVELLGRHLKDSPVLAWLIECRSLLNPELVALPGQADDVERARYGRGLDHLITRLDEDFVDAPISPHGLLEYLRLKIATDTTEDEPAADPDTAARVTALTVHKAKGLEYEKVLIPYTDTDFAKGSWFRDAAVVTTKKGPRFIWRWHILGKDKPITNVAPADSGLWGAEQTERVREETRLLYVAITRARDELLIFVVDKGNRQKRAGTLPSSWNDLLKMGVG
jgi:DNA helicase-2/ATP-dependent DNA helicase PcrA